MPNSANVIRVVQSLPENVSGVLALDKLESPIVRQGLDYWLKLRGDRLYPSRSEMAPRELASLLRHVVLLRVVAGGADYEYRIVGDAHVISHGFNMQGMRVSDVDKFSPGYSPFSRASMTAQFGVAMRMRFADGWSAVKIGSSTFTVKVYSCRWDLTNSPSITS